MRYNKRSAFLYMTGATICQNRRIGTKAGIRRISNFLSFEPDIVSVQLDGKQLRLEPGQTVIPHGPDRELTVAEVLPRRKSA
jgi:hypothetical protein